MLRSASSQELLSGTNYIIIRPILVNKSTSTDTSTDKLRNFSWNLILLKC